MEKRDREGRREGSQCLLKPATPWAGPAAQFAGLVQNENVRPCAYKLLRNSERQQQSIQPSTGPFK